MSALHSGIKPKGHSIADHSGTIPDSEVVRGALSNPDHSQRCSDEK